LFTQIIKTKKQKKTKKQSKLNRRDYTVLGGAFFWRYNRGENFFFLALLHLASDKFLYF
jgi:uncharacterized protein (UPF0303 family)